MKLPSIIFVFLLLFSQVVAADPPNANLDEKLLSILTIHPDALKEIVPFAKKLDAPTEEEVLKLHILINEGDVNYNVDLGTYCLHGLVKGKDCWPNALMMYRRAARNNVQVQITLGKLFEFGATHDDSEFADQYLSESYYWYAYAASSGDAGALKLSEDIAKKMTPRQKEVLDSRVNELKHSSQNTTSVIVR